MKIKCNICSTGFYKLRHGKYGAFGGCSNYPVCRSTMKIHDLVFEFFVEKGINVYRWKKECYKCGKHTDVYSYFLYYELEQLDESYQSVHGLGLGDVPWIDNRLKHEIPSIKECYSKFTDSTYIANMCVYCGVLQGKNYVVDDPHEIMTELFHDRSMEQYFFRKISIDEKDIELRNEFYHLFKDE